MSRFHYLNQEDLEINPASEDTQLMLCSLTSIPLLDTSLFLSTPLLYNVIYLDLSNTRRIEGWTRFLSSRVFDNLRILKLRGLRLTDQAIPGDTLRTWLRLWSLDLRDNSLTDMAIDILLADAFAPLIRRGPIESLYEDPPVYQARADPNHSYFLNDSPVPLRPDTTDTFIKYVKAHADLKGDSSYVLPDRDPMKKSTGLTHLYLSDNKFTSKGIRKVLEFSNRLQVLDVGTVPANPSFPYIIPDTVPFCQPDTAPFLHWQAGSRIEKLRIHHSIVTQIPTIVQGRLELGYISKHLRKAEMFGKTVPPRFTPLENNRLTSLTLTDIPLKSTGLTIRRLNNFLRHCAEQEQTLLSAARRGVRNHRSPPLLPGLRKLRLEFIKERTGAKEIGPSVSGGQDADEFQEQSMGGFSFFAEEKKLMSPLLRRGGENGGWSASWNSKEISLAEGGWSASWHSKKSSLAEGADLKDVIEELKIFRQREQPRWGGSLELVVPRVR